jgi:hypothetical protein
MIVKEVKIPSTLCGILTNVFLTNKLKNKTFKKMSPVNGILFYNVVHLHYRRVRRVRVDGVGHMSHSLLQERSVTPRLPKQDDPGPRVQRYR